MFSKKTIKDGYQSEIDKFFHEFDGKRTELPKARLDEIAKHKPIFEKRDKAIKDQPSEIWQDF